METQQETAKQILNGLGYKNVENIIPTAYGATAGQLTLYMGEVDEILPQAAKQRELGMKKDEHFIAEGVTKELIAWYLTAKN